MLIAITGGIGSGKSIVSQALRSMGYTVYDCDSRAQWVMTHDPILREQLIALFGQETYLADGSLNKPHLSTAIFGNAEALAKMNACVHPAVARDLMTEDQNEGQDERKPFFFESAILFERINRTRQHKLTEELVEERREEARRAAEARAAEKERDANDEE